MLKAIFGAKGQIAVGIIFCIATAYQALWWGFVTKPTTAAIFWLSIEALFYASYGVVSAALGYKATERVETAVVENVENAEKVEVNSGRLS